MVLVAVTVWEVTVNTLGYKTFAAFSRAVLLVGLTHVECVV